MRAIPYALFIRFLRLRVWLAAVVLPALIALFMVLGHRAGGGEPAVLVTRWALFWLEWALPCLALLFLLSAPGEARQDLLILSPSGWPGGVIGRFIGAVAIFGGCHLLLAAVLVSSLAAAGGGPAGRVDRVATEIFLGTPGSGGRPAGSLARPWPAGRLEPDWLSQVAAGTSWSFVFTGLPPGTPFNARVKALIARTLSDETGSRKITDLARARSAPAEAGYLGPDGKTVPIARVELADATATEIAIPPAAVDAAGRLVVVLSRVEEEAGSSGGVKWGPRFFWFDSGGKDPSAAHDLRLAVGGIPFAENVLRASLPPLGALLLIAALGVAASALFSPGVAFGASLALFLISSSKGFLAGILTAFERRSALELLSDPAAPSHPLQHAPTWFDRGLEAFLRASMEVLPDFSSFQAGRILARGEAVPQAAIAGALGLGACAAAVLLAAALLFPARREPHA